MNRDRRGERGGFVHEAVLRVVLLLLVLGQIVFLGSRYRMRLDLTEDQMFTLTASTRNVLASLQDRLLIECYFSPEEKLSTAFRERRHALNGFLDELVQLSDGKVVLQRFDPQDDQMIKEKAERLGIEGLTITDQGEATFAFKEIWQGMRLMYGADRQQVVPFVNFHFQTQAPTAVWEAQLTPAIKALTVEEKPVIGLLAFATEAAQRSPFGGPQGGQSKGYTRLAEIVEGQYELRNVSLAEGQLVPDDIGTLMLVRPKNLTDRQKYAIDQFLMRGGNLVVFADTAEVEIGQQRLFRTRQVSYDAPGSAVKFLEQLKHYGVEVGTEVVAEALAQARDTEGFGVLRQTVFGALPSRLEPYPYWFHALPLDYAAIADQIARQQGGADGDLEELTRRYREIFKPGVDTENAMLKAMKRGPGMFWACPVDLKPELPAGVEGKVLLRTSPFAFTEAPPPDFNPLGYGRHPKEQQAAFNGFRTRIATRLNSEPRQQFGLMAQLSGTFGSFFENKAIPPRKPEEKKAPPPADPLQGPVRESPVKEAGKGADGGASAQEPETQEPETQEPETQEPETQDPEKKPAAAEQGPPLPGEAQEPEEEKERDPDPVFRAPATAQLIVIGDADFLRDDLLPHSNEYGQVGPVSAFGPTFFSNLVDWLAEDQDLLALRNKTSPDRRLKLAVDELQGQPGDYAATIKAREKLLGWLNVGLPIGAILAIWAIVGIRRRARKQEFLASVES